MSEFDVRPLAPGVPTNAVKATATAGAAGAAVAFRTQGSSGGFLIGNFPAYVTIKAQTTTAGPGFHIAFGDSTVGAPTIADMLITDADEWQRVLVPANATHIRAFGEGTTVGIVYAYLSS